MKRLKYFLGREADAASLCSTPPEALHGLQNPVTAGEVGKGQRRVPGRASVLPILERALLLEVFLLIEEAVLQCIGAIQAGGCLARSLVLLNGLVEAVQLAEQGHVQLSEADLEGREGR